ncbi:hypothetical protein E8E95_18225 [Pseudomonas sp. BN414]|nr:hypothetical protein [Pseudomonas sp. BN414]
MRLETNSPLYRVDEAVRRRVAREEDAPVDLDAVRQGIRVSLSELGKARAAQKNDDIDQSNLPDGIKELLKLIRALKAQIAERQAELQAIAADQSLDEENRLQRLEALRGELASLQGALSSANLNLAKATRDAGLSDEQSLEVGKLLNA